MMTAKEARQSVALSDAEKTELDRIEKAVDAAIFPADRKWDGLARNFTVYMTEKSAPLGAIYVDPGLSASALRLLNIFKYRREDDGWVVGMTAAMGPYGDIEAIHYTLEPAPHNPSQPSQVIVKATTSRTGSSQPEMSWFGDEFQAPMKPVLSIIFGTYNRIDHLQRAVASVRRSARRLDYEIIVCDGGSTDGSRKWLAEQPDIVLVGERRLEGAVKAFNQCYAISRGEFIANLNDDCVVQGEALTEGVKYLQSHPKTGQVAFGFKGEGEDWHINDIYEHEKFPNVTWPTTYANFGITRRSVADKVVEITGGFWCPVYKTYAADCELSAWVWKLGHRVDKLPHQRVIDTRADDALRTTNNKNSGLEARRMYARWPAEAFRVEGPDPRVGKDELARFRTIKEGKKEETPKEEVDMLATFVEMVGWPAPEEEKRLQKLAPLVRALDPVEGQFPKRVPFSTTERVLHVSMGTDADPQDAQVRALAAMGGAGYKQLRWYADFPDHEARQKAIIDAALELKPTIVFMQLQAQNVVDVETVKQLRFVTEMQGSHAVIVTWNGDIGDVNSPYNVDWQTALGRMVDLNLHSSYSHVRALRAAGVHNAGYLQIGYDEQQYCLDPAPATYDVCFLGSRYADGNAFTKTLARHDAGLRDQAVTAMQKAFGDRFGLYGNGWGGKQQTVPLDKAHEVYQRSKIGLNVSLVNFFGAYSSDRLHRILGCGSLALTKRFPLMSTWGGLKHGENCLIWDHPDQAVEMAKNVLVDPERLTTIATAGQKLAVENHTWIVRMGEFQTYVDAVRAARK